MKKGRGTKRALAMSVLAMVLCIAMLIGTTFAWFTDSVTSANNRIVAGNLDVELYYQNDETTEWTKVTSETNIFKDSKETLWEPGHTEVIKLKIANEGSLALKYQLGVNIASEIGSVNVYGDPFKLSDYIYFGVVEGANDYADRDEAIRAVEASASVIREGYSRANSLEAKEESFLTMIVYMPTFIGNEANYAQDANIPVINLGLNLFATQFTSEKDSFGKDYDATAPWTGSVDTDWYYTNPDAAEFTLTSAEELAGLAKLVNDGVDTFENQSIKLGANIDLNNISWTPIGSSKGAAYKFDGRFYGNGYTIYNLYVTGTTGLGLFGYVFNAAHIEGVSIENAYVSGRDYVGAVLGTGYLDVNCLKNCTVKNATIIAVPYLTADGVYDGGAKAGAVAGYAINGHIVGNKAIDCKIMAYRDLGGIVGMVSGENHPVTVSGNEVSMVTLSYVGAFGEYEGDKEKGYMNEICGRSSNATVENNIIGEGVILDKSAEKAIMIFTVDELFAFAAKVNSGVSYSGQTVILGADIDLENREWTPIGNATYSFQGIFDGNGKVIKNLKITGNKSNVGLFGFTTNGEIRNLTVENARVSGRLNVAVVAGTPYTSKYNNITVKGHIEVNGMAYVGGVGGKNVYANWNNITVDADATSYVKANSVENGIAYRTYVGGVAGFVAEGSHVISNVISNIDVIGTTCDVGGITGIAHYGTTFKNITCSGDVTITNAAEIGDAEEMGGIAGVWYNEAGYKVSFIDCAYTGKLTANVAGVDLSDNTIVGAAYKSADQGELVILDYYEDGGITYVKSGLKNETVTLYQVPADYEEDTVTIPEGVTAIGGYAFAYNSNIDKIVLPSTVTTLNDRAFRDTSASTVVLNEGLTNISYQAFRNASNVETVVIPSTVTTISKEAFQNSGVKTLTVPATVTSLEYGAMRDMKKLETVTIEGNVDIPVYAFRACTELKTVYLNGTNVTFGGGSKGMIFTNKENGDGSAITVYVANEIIKDRLLAADTAAKDYGGYTIVCSDTANSDGIYVDENGAKYAYADNNQKISDVIVSGAQTIILPSGNFIVPDSAQGKTLTFVGNGDTQIATQDDGSYEGCDYSLDGATVTFEGVVINTDSRTYTGYARCKGTYNNCTINGAYTLYGESVFNNCTFNVTGDTYNIWTWGAKTVEFNNCTFNTDGKSILVYNQSCDVYVNDCVFNDRTNGTGFTKSALETGVDGVGPKYNIYINNTEFNGFAENDKCVGYKNIVGNKNSLTDAYLNIVVDGVDVY